MKLVEQQEGQTMIVKSTEYYCDRVWQTAEQLINTKRIKSLWDKTARIEFGCDGIIPVQ